MPNDLRQSIESIRLDVDAVKVSVWPKQSPCVRRLTIDECDLFTVRSEGMTDLQRVCLLCQLSLCDADGVRCYGDSEEDRIAIGKLDPRALAEIAAAAAQLNFVTEKAVETAKKNYAETT